MGVVAPSGKCHGGASISGTWSNVSDVVVR